MMPQPRGAECDANTHGSAAGHIPRISRTSIEPHITSYARFRVSRNAGKIISVAFVSTRTDLLRRLCGERLPRFSTVCKLQLVACHLPACGTPVGSCTNHAPGAPDEALATFEGCSRTPPSNGHQSKSKTEAGFSHVTASNTEICTPKIQDKIGERGPPLLGKRRAPAQHWSSCAV